MSFEIKPYTRIVEITPDDARQILEENTDNRPLSVSTINRYAGDIDRGNWKMNGETIKIALDGRVIDGQHRLCAVIQSGRPIKSMVTYDLDFEVFDTVDCGRKRSASDVFAVRKEKHYTNLAGSLRIYARYENNEILKPDNTLTNVDIEKVLERHPGMRESVEFVQKYKTSIFAPSIAAACHYIFSNIDKQEADNFMIKVLTGVGIGASDPTHLLRNRLIENKASKSKLNRKHILALTFKAWNFFRDGKVMKNLMYRGDGEGAEAFPIPK